MRLLYWVFAYIGVMSVFAAFIYGFRYAPAAPRANYLFNVILYGAFITIHLVMTRPWFKHAVYGRPEGALRERQIYVSIAVLTWGLLLLLHRPVPGPSLTLPTWAHFVGFCLVLLGAVAVFEGATFEKMNGLFGVPGSQLSHTHGTETPLFTEGPYARVRHPMYRAVVLTYAASLLIHSNAAQLFWAVLLGGTLVAFIPFEEAQLLAARGEQYRAYMQRTPYRLVRGVW